MNSLESVNINAQEKTYPKWNNVCFPFFPLPFFPPPPPLASPKSSSIGVDVPDPDSLQAFPVGRPSPHRTVPRVRPAMRTFGFGAAGSAGNASALFALGVCEEEGVLGALGRGEGRLDATGAAVVPQAVVAVFRLLDREEDVEDEDRGGNGLLEDAEEGRAPVRPTADREDWAVDDFKRSTRLPPAPLPFTVDGDMPGRSPPGPGRAG